MDDTDDTDLLPSVLSVKSVSSVASFIPFCVSPKLKTQNCFYRVVSAGVPTCGSTLRADGESS